MIQDLRHGLRGLVHSPGFTAVAILTLGVGIGANAAIFSVVNALFLHLPGVSDPANVAAVRVRYTKLNLKSASVSAPDFADVDQSGQIFHAAALEMSRDFTYLAGGEPERILGSAVSWKWFDVFGAKPILGRVFRPEEDQPGANHEAVLAYDAWTRLFGADAHVVGKSIELDEQPYQVIGVMGRKFDWPSETELWVPLGLARDAFGEANRYNESYFALARIRPSVGLDRARAYVSLLADRNIEHGPQAAFARDSGWGMFAAPLTDFVYGDLKGPMVILMGAVGFVLLIACSNIAGLMLARATGRRKEVTVRAALGANRWDLIRPTLVQGLLLAGAGACLGLVLAAEGIRLLLLLAPPAVATGLAVPMDAYVLSFTAIAGIVSGLLFGIAPAWRVSGIRDFGELKEGGRSGTAGRARQRMRGALAAGQMALALVLLVGVGLFLKSLMSMQQVAPGFQPRGVMTAAVSLPKARYHQQERQIAFYRAVIDRLARQPGVRGAAAAVPMPFTGSVSSASFEIEGQPVGPGNPGPHGDVRLVSPGYFEVMGIPLRSGREFTAEDHLGSEPVTVIDENLARAYWPNRNPIGQRIRRGRQDSWATIVGVVAHVKQSSLVGDSGKGVYYYPLFQQAGFPGAYLLAGTSGDPGPLGGAIRGAVRAADPSLPVYDVKTMEQRVSASLAPQRFAVTVLGFFAGIALALAALGLYGVIAHSVAQRTQEIGVRMALGAGTRQVLAMVIGQGMRLAAIGAAIGLGGAYGLARALSSQLFEVSAADPAIFLGSAAALAAVALAACYIPARRAMRVDPIVALRYE